MIERKVGVLDGVEFRVCDACTHWSMTSAGDGQEWDLELMFINARRLQQEDKAARTPSERRVYFALDAPSDDTTSET